MIESALTPRSRASPATLSASTWLLRALTTTCAPSPASFSTVARPILRPEPVTRATFPSSLPISVSPLIMVERSPKELPEGEPGDNAVEQKVVPPDRRADRAGDHRPPQLRAMIGLGQQD